MTRQQLAATLDATIREDDRGYETPCWIWPLAPKSTGYGLWRRQGDSRLAHRVAYERAVGPIPPGLEIDHLCRVKVCVRPDHLEPVTHAENGRRGARAKLTHATVAQIRSGLAAGAHPQSLAAQFGVSKATVYNLKAGRIWSSSS